MKKMIAAIFAILLTCHPAYAGTMYTTEDLNVRTLPGYDGQIVDVLEAGEPVETLMTIERERSWTIVQYGDGLKAVCADYLTDEKSAPAMHLYGNCRITFYDAGPCCCGAYASGITASGAPVQVNHTVANGSLPFGTRLMIDGQEYVVEDRGVGEFEIDIYVATHEEANQRGLYYTEVFIID